jgi:hypothetical protein
MEKPVAAPGQSFDISRRFGCVPQRFPQSLYGVVDAVIEVNKRVAGPYPLSQFLALDYLARLFQKNVKNLKRLFLEPDFVAIPA